MKLHKREIVFYTILSFAVIVTVVLFWVSCGIKEANENQMFSSKEDKEYKYHYMLIRTGFADEKSGNLYEGAKESGEELDILVEDACELGNLEDTPEEMLKTAIAAKVDGIILEAEESSELEALIDEASEQGIPVVTVGHDMPDSKRKCFVGIDVKQTGEMFASRILRQYYGEKLDVAVLTDRGKDISADSVYHHIEQELAGENAQVRPIEISGENAFSTDEEIRRLFLDKEELPDVLVCLNEEDTIGVCKAAVDYNMVGKLKIIGYSAREEVVTAIEKNIVDSSIMVNMSEMGEKAVRALYKNRDRKSTKTQITVVPQVIEYMNIRQYRKETE